MTLRIERSTTETGTTFRLSGRIGAENLMELKTEIEGKRAATALDLEHVTLVDVEGVRFLTTCESQGIKLIHCSPYIREWMVRERKS